MKAALGAAGAKYISTDDSSSADKQLTDVENLISQGANAVIILAQDQDAIQPAINKAMTRVFRSSLMTACSGTRTLSTSPSTTRASAN